MPESKTSGRSKSILVPQLIQEFAEFCTGEEFQAAIDDWEADHCDGFSGADLAGEQKLEWTALFEEYVRLVERRMEGFAEERGVSTDDLFEQLAECNKSDTGIQEFLPKVLTNCEYMHFAQQMKEMAEHGYRRSDALSAAAHQSGQGTNISGVWRADGSFSTADMDRFLKELKCPWVFRKMIVNASSKITDIFIEQSDELLEMRYKLPLFGTRTLSFPLDDTLRNTRNLWGQYSGR